MTEREKRSLRRAESGNAGTQKTPTPTPAVKALAGQISLSDILASIEATAVYIDVNGNKDEV